MTPSARLWVYEIEPRARLTRAVERARPHAFALLALGVALYGCGSAGVHPAPRDARAAGGLPLWRPVSLAGIAYGQGHGSGPRAIPTSNGDQFDATPVRPAASPKVGIQLAKKSSLRSRPAPAVRAAAEPSPTPIAATEPQRPETPPAVAVHADVEKYAARDARSSTQQQYRGGDVVVITASTLVIILLVVLLIVLLIR